MFFNSPSIAKSIDSHMDRLIAMTSGEAANRATADEMEGQLFREILALGRELMQLFLTRRSEQEVIESRWTEAETSYGYAGQKTRAYLSIFGEVMIERAYYWQAGVGGHHPLDAALSLPERKYSDWVQAMVSELSVLKPEGEAVGLLERWFGWRVPKRAGQQMISHQASAVAAYYAQADRAAPDADDTILVALADGKGIPMNRADSPPPQARRGRGQKKTAKKEAIITASYTIAPYVRTPDDLIQALLPDEPATTTPQPSRPKPTGKRVFGTLTGKEKALTHLARQVAEREQAQLTERVVLTDGSLSLQRQVEHHLPHFTLILDIMHVLHYLWDAANVLLGETHPQRTAWMRTALRCLLDNDLDTLVAQLETQAARPKLAQHKRKTLSKVVNYLY